MGPASDVYCNVPACSRLQAVTTSCQCEAEEASKANAVSILPTGVYNGIGSLSQRYSGCGGSEGAPS